MRQGGDCYGGHVIYMILMQGNLRLHAVQLTGANGNAGQKRAVLAQATPDRRAVCSCLPRDLVIRATRLLLPQSCRIQQWQPICRVAQASYTLVRKHF